MRVWYAMAGAIAVVGLAALPAKGRGVLVNCLGFWLPAVATIGDTEKGVDLPHNPSVYTGYWVREDDTKF